MRALTFWKTVTVDKDNSLEGLINLLEEADIHYCVVGGQAVNAYVEPLVSLDLDLIVALDQLDRVERLLSKLFSVKRFPHGLNISFPNSDLRVQIQTDRRYAAFPQHASPRDVLGLTLPVASLEDILQGKIWAALNPDCRPSKRQKDLADIARLLEAYPNLQSQVPQEILQRLI